MYFSTYTTGVAVSWFRLVLVGLVFDSRLNKITAEAYL